MPKEKEAVVKDKAPRQTDMPDFLVQAWRRGGFLPYDAAAVAAKQGCGSGTPHTRCYDRAQPHAFQRACF